VTEAHFAVVFFEIFTLEPDDGCQIVGRQHNGHKFKRLGTTIFIHQDAAHRGLGTQNSVLLI
jgi:hypothetical protein